MLDTSALLEVDNLEPFDDEICLSAICYGELAMGVAIARSASERLSRQSILANLDGRGANWRPFDRLAAQAYAELAAVVWQKRPAHARSKDIMIAGHAFSLGASLATLNRADFEAVSDLVPLVHPVRIT